MTIDILNFFMGCLPLADVSGVSNSVQDRHFLSFFNNGKLYFSTIVTF